MKEEAVININGIGRNSNVFKLIGKMKIESTDVVGGRWMRENDGTLHLNGDKANV